MCGGAVLLYIQWIQMAYRYGDVEVAYGNKHG